ncbi:MAG: sensor domain-containing diguanylate cyclase [Candidatus Firestonebacteria bacterium]
MTFKNLLPKSVKMLKLLEHMYEGVYFVDTDRKILYWIRGAEKITGYVSKEVKNTYCYNDILMHVDKDGKSLCHDGCPLVGSIKTKKECGAEVFLHHKNGHRVPVNVQAIPVKDGSGKVVGAFEVFSEKLSRVELAERMRVLQNEAMLDRLTEIGNRRYFDTNLYGKLQQASRYGLRFGLLFLDIDNFKKVNDTYGHEAGDRVLKMLAKTLASNVRAFDVICRWGGEEFAVLIERIGPEQLASRAEELRMLVAQSAILSGKETLKVTISIGGTLSKDDDTVSSITERADKLMYQSKQAGKNRVTLG